MFDRNNNDNHCYNVDNIKVIKESSPIVGELLEKEYTRQKNNIELIASENYCSEAILAATGSCLSWKYAEGYPAERSTGNVGRYYGGTEFVDRIEEYACDKWKEVFNTDYHVNVQPHSGSQANFSAYKALLNIGDKVLSFSLDNGGHLTHGSAVNFSGKTYDMHFYDVDTEGFIDLEDVRKKAHSIMPKVIMTGASAYSRNIDFSKFHEIAKEVGAYLISDIAHVAGLIAAGVHSSPFGYADIITTTTHKTLRGPRGGMIFCKQEFASKVDSAVFPYSQGGPLEHVIAGKAICAEEALLPEYKKYIEQVVKNSKACCEHFLKLNYKVITGGTDNHLFMLDLSGYKFSGKDLQEKLDEVGITLNKNCIPGDKRSPKETSGVRIGTAPMTTRGYLEEDFVLVATKIDEVIKKMETEYA